MANLKLIKLNKVLAKNIWIEQQRLNQANPFGHSAMAVTKAVEQLGYVQIDTINVIERCHHHILFNRIPHYQKSYLEKAQSEDKSIFEYWTHALSYIPTSKYKYYIPQMKNIKTNQGYWHGRVSTNDYKKVIALLKKGPLSVRDIKDDVLKEKEHDWDSKKPSKRALQLGFYKGDIVIARREGMLKIYDLASQHFNWNKQPKAATINEILNYKIDRALNAQGIVSLDSICYLNPSQKKKIESLLQSRIKNNTLIEVHINNLEKTKFWLEPKRLETKVKESHETHILSPFDPLIIQRKRLKMFFDYEHLFEAYVPPAKRKFGYFTLPILHTNNIVALLDLKTDRQNKKLLIQSWHWLPKQKSQNLKLLIENKLNQFEKFQLS